MHLTFVELHGALAMGEIFRPLTVVHIAVRPDLLAVAVLLAVFVLADVAAPIGPPAGGSGQHAV